MSGRPAPLPAGAIVDGLQVERLLGQGRSGATYLVVDPGLGTRFVLKEYLPEGLALRDPQGQVRPLDANAFAAGRQRFIDAARAVAAVRHPALQPLLRVLEANGTAACLLGWTPGETLAARLGRGAPITPDTLRRIATEIAGALAALHGAGLVHMDVKPANVLLTDDDAPLLLDFDAVVAIGDRRGARHGSPGYAAPEHADAGLATGPWTDAYGLAATLYRCLAGEVPPPAGERLAAVTAGRADPLPPLPRVQAALADAVEHGLRLAPAERPQDLAAWRQAFESLDWRLRAAAGTGGERERRGWLPFTLLGLLVAGMGAAGLYLLMDGERTDEQPIPAPSTAPLPDPATDSAAERGRWEAALEADTVNAYRRFLADYPDSRHAAQAQLQLGLIDDREWQALVAEDTLAALRDYLERFPNGRHQAEAMQRIDALEQEAAQAERERIAAEQDEAEAWRLAQAAGTVAALDAYLAAHPAGPHAQEAQGLRRMLADRANDDQAFATARQLGTRAALQAYIDAFPQGAHVGAALQAIDDATLRPGKRFRDCADCPEMVVVPAGSFTQGAAGDAPLASPAERPRREVAIARPFAIGASEVTLAQWDACVAAGGCARTLPDNGWGRGARPAIMVSWEDAQQYVAWLSQATGQAYRLPSESEWEYAARAGETGELPGGPSGVCAFANIAGAETAFDWKHAACEDAFVLGTAPAGSLRANAFGLHDLLGNVAEWTADCWNLSYLDAPADGSAWTRGICSSHPTRGGSWVTGTREARLPARFNLRAGDRNDFTGLRVAREVRE